MVAYSLLRTAVAALLSAALILPAAPAAVHAAAGVRACDGGWQELVIPDASFRSTPSEAITRAGSLAWVVGTTSQGFLTLRWNGRRLVQVDTDLRGRRGLLGGVATGPRSLLGVGMRRPRPRDLTELIGRVDATRWVQQSAPLIRGADAALTDIVRLPSRTAWAVGSSLESGRSRAIAMRRREGRWRRVDPASGRGSSGLLGVARAAGGDVWAVGWRGRGQPRPMIARRRGSTWKVTSGASLPRGSAVLTDVAFRRPDDGWAVGYLVRRGSSVHRPILEHWDGRRWRRVALAWSGGMSAIPRSVAVGRDGSLWIGGAQLATGSREARGFVAQRTRGTWTLKVLDTPADLHSDIKSVAAVDGGAVAVGTVGATAFAMRTCAGAATAASSRDRRIDVSRIRGRRVVTGDHELAAGRPGPKVASPGPSVRLKPAVAPSGFRLRDVAADVGLDLRTSTWGAVTGDFDRDGWTDLLISRHAEARPLLALGGAGTFKLTRSRAFSAIDRHGCDAADVDRDGRLDVLCVTGRQRGNSVDRHELSLAPGTAAARLSRGARGLSDPLGRGRRVTFIRLDRDAYPEVFITNQPEREDAMPAPNRFFRNVGGSFVPAPEVGLDQPSGGFCAEAVDVDGDGDQDLLHCQDSPADGRPAGLRVYENRAGTLVERSRALGVKPIGDIDVTIADVSGDGRPELIQLSYDSLRISRRTATGFRRIYQASLTWGQALAAGDVDGDGRIDLYVVRSGTRVNKPDLLLVNDGRGRSFTSVRIPQTRLGSGEDVVALDYDRNGLTDFVVLNGRGARRGPIQLLAAFPRSASAVDG